jgi:glutamate N-acetyltransferase / amino-acid N-acetyltransferase
METYSSESEYIGDLQGRSALPAGFRAAAAPLSFFPTEKRVKEPMRMNLSLILLDEPTAAFAAAYTRNAMPGAPVLIGRRRLANPLLRGVLINNRISNVCTPGGMENALRLMDALGKVLDAPGDQFLPASTGIIGWRLPVEEMERALPSLRDGLQADSILPLARAIMTTDRWPKVRRAAAGSGSVVGIVKGAGMMEPNLATMLCFLCTDLAVPRGQLREHLAWCAERSFNRISVDSDQSTSDTILLMSSGRGGGVSPDAFRAALLSVCSGLAEDVVRNGEGVGHVVRVTVRGARDEGTAREIGKAVINSPLVKTAICGNDPNVGRIASAVGDYLGNAGLPTDPRSVRIAMGGIEIFSEGFFRLTPEKEAALSGYLSECAQDPAHKGWPEHDRTVGIEVTLDGPSPAVQVLGADLSREYVSENADYRS